MRITWDGILWLEPDYEYQFTLVSDANASARLNGETIAEHSSYKTITKTRFTYTPSVKKNTLQIHYADDDEISHIALLWMNGYGDYVPVPSRYFSPPGNAHFDFWKRYFEDWASSCIPFFLIVLFASAVYLASDRFDKLTEPGQALAANLAAAILACLGFAIRFFIADQSGWNYQADEAVVGIMARRIAEGQSLPLVYLGQAYGGPLLSYLMAPLTAFDSLNPYLIRGVPVALSSFAAIGIYLAAKRFFGLKSALIAMLFWVCCPVMLMVYGLMCMVGPIEIILLLLPVMLWARYALTEPNALSIGFTLLAGCLSGVALWGNLQALFIVFPLWVELVWLAVNRNHLRLIGLYLAGLTLGALPLIIFNAVNSMATLRYFLVKNSANWLFEFQVIKAFFYEALPEFLGQSVRWQPLEYDLPNTFESGVSLWPTAYGPTLLFGVVIVSSALWIVFAWNDSDRETHVFVRYLFSVVCMGILLFCLSSIPDKSSRHLLLVYPAYLMLLGWFISNLLNHQKAIGCALLALLLTWNIQGYQQTNPAHYFQPYHYLFWGKSIPRAFDDGFQALLEKNAIDGVYADYWVGENLSYAMDEAIPVFSNPPRRVDQAVAVLGAKCPAYVYHANEHNLDVYLAALHALGFEERLRLPFLVYAPGAKRVMPKNEINVVTKSTFNNFHLFDGNLHTWWSPGPEDRQIQFQFNVPRQMREIVILFQSEGQGAIRAISSDGGKNMFPIRDEDVQTILSYSIIQRSFEAAQASAVTVDIENNPSRPLKIFDVFFIEQ